MKKIFLLFVIIIFQISIIPSEHGIYMLVNANIKGDFNNVAVSSKSALHSAGFKILSFYDIATPDIVSENKDERCSYKGKLIVVSNDEYIKLLTSFGKKYLAAGFIRIGVYENADGIQINIADPETINRIIFNDLPDDKYNLIVSKTKQWKSKLINALQSVDGGTKVKLAKEPIRSDEDLRDASKDMFMLVGKMTFFEDEDQFPVIHQRSNNEGRNGLERIKKEFYKNVESFQPIKEDRDYRWTSSPENLKWKLISEIYSPDSTAILLGVTRARTEAVSFKIVGKDESPGNMCQGIGHIPAYPIEVLVMMMDKKIVVYTPREMFRMDMYFWDAGMGAFMNHMSMPGILDDSIMRALTGK